MAASARHAGPRSTNPGSSCASPSPTPRSSRARTISPASRSIWGSGPRRRSAQTFAPRTAAARVLFGSDGHVGIRPKRRRNQREAVRGAAARNVRGEGMISRASAALAAATLSVMLFVPSAARAMPAAMMNEPPAPWTDAGAKPFVRRDAANHVTAIGMVTPAATVKALPAHRSEAVYPLDGAGLVRSANLQRHPVGHEPMHVYDLPRFDPDR